MTGFLLSRLTQSAVLLLAMSLAVFILLGLMPGDPIDLMVAGNPKASPDDIERLRQVYGLDQPLMKRYGTWLAAALSGDFGYSRLFSRPVLEILQARLGVTLTLMGSVLALSFLTALALGITAARKRYTAADTAIGTLCFAGVALPSFWIALVLMAIFSVWLNLLPAGGMAPADASFLTRCSHWVLPIATLGLGTTAVYTRHLRAAMIELLSADHIRTARAKGCGEWRIVTRHALRGAIVPLVTLLALDTGALFGGALVTETIFGLQGMGKTIYDAIMGNDYNLALVALLLVTAMVLAGNFLADIAYAALDPRVRLGQETRAA